MKFPICTSVEEREGAGDRFTYQTTRSDFESIHGGFKKKEYGMPCSFFSKVDFKIGSQCASPGVTS
jgi:hypothetical protein